MNSQKQFRIGHVAELLGVQRFVIRFWEKEFNLKGYRTSGGQRFYKQKDIDHFKLIQTLLYEKKFTIAGAKKILSEQLSKKPEATAVDTACKVTTLGYNFLEQIAQIRDQLIKLRSLL